jgi:ABC-type sugar transport system substrate-binding protein
MKRGAWRTALLACPVVLLALGCGSDDGGSPRGTSDVRVAAVIKGLDNPFFVTMRDGLVATARRHDVRVRVAAAPAGLQDTAGQATDLENLPADDSSCYVVNPINPTNLVSALSRLPDKAPIINVDSVVDKEAARARRAHKPGRHAASSYSWSRPPSRSRRRTALGRVRGKGTSSPIESGASRSKARCGRRRL